MPSDLTIFAAKYLVFIDAVLAIIMLAWLVYRRPHLDVLKWVIAGVVMLLLSGIIAKIGSAVYNDPRPFTTDHIQPLISHAADNGFPSDHALLAAAIVAEIAIAAVAFATFRFVRLSYVLPFIVLGALVDAARVGAGIHHLQDVIGSTVFVAIAAVIALLVAPAFTRRLMPYVPASMLDTPVTEPSNPPAT